MMNNLFSIFDPSQSMMNMSWMSMTFPTMLLMSMTIKNKNQSKTISVFKLINQAIGKEVKTMLNTNNKKSSETFMKLTFFFIMITNLLALFPFIFTPTAHMSISFSTAITMWISTLIMGWLSFPKHMMSHMVPLGTPTMLMNFMVLIELVSNLIRPITLSVRLSANMVAGHLLMSLLSNFSMSSTKIFTMCALPLFILTLLEMAVAMIQAYVFMTLITLYHNEIF